MTQPKPKKGKTADTLPTFTPIKPSEHKRSTSGIPSDRQTKQMPLIKPTGPFPSAPLPGVTGGLKNTNKK